MESTNPFLVLSVINGMCQNYFHSYCLPAEISSCPTTFLVLRRQGILPKPTLSYKFYCATYFLCFGIQKSSSFSHAPFFHFLFFPELVEYASYRKYGYLLIFDYKSIHIWKCKRSYYLALVTQLVDSLVLYGKYYWNNRNKHSDRAKECQELLKTWWKIDEKIGTIENNPFNNTNFSNLLMLGIEDANMQKKKKK